MSIQKTEKFQLLSNNNVGIVGKYTCKEIELLINLFPRLNRMNIMIYPDNVHNIYKSLLFKINQKLRYLFSLCLVMRHERILETIKS